MTWSLVNEDNSSSESQESVKGSFSLVPEENEEEGWGQWLGRLGAQTGAAVTEKIGGFPGDVKQGLGDLAINLYETAGIYPTEEELKKVVYEPNKSLFENMGNVLSSASWFNEPSKKREAPDWIKQVFKGGPETEQMATGFSSTTSGDIRKGLSEITGGYTEPKNKGEEIWRNFVGDMVDLGVVPSRFRMSIPRRIGASLGSELLGETAKAISGKESDKQKVKSGSMFAFSVINPGGAKRYVENMYNEVRDIVPQGSTANVNQSVPRINNFINNTNRSGIRTASTRAVTEDAEGFRNMINQHNGNPPIHALLDAKQRINENRSRFYATSADAMERRIGRQLYGNLMNEVDRTIEDALNQVPNIQQHHPLDLSRNANQAWSTLHEAESASRFMRRVIPKSLRGSAMAALFEIGFQHPSVAAKGVAASAAGLGMITGARLLTQVMNSPTLRQYYIDTVRHAMAGNSKAALSSWNKLNDAWELEEKNESIKSRQSRDSSLPNDQPNSRQK